MVPACCEPVLDDSDNDSADGQECQVGGVEGGGSAERGCHPFAGARTWTWRGVAERAVAAGWGVAEVEGATARERGAGGKGWPG